VDVSIVDGGGPSQEGDDPWQTRESPVAPPEDPARRSGRLQPPPPGEPSAGWDAWDARGETPWSARPVPPPAAGTDTDQWGFPQEQGDFPPAAPWPSPPSFQPGLVGPEERTAAWPMPPGQPWPPRRRRRTGALVAALALVVVAGLVGAGVGATLAHRRTSVSEPPNFAAFPPAGGTSNGNANAASIAAQVSPGVVDVNTTLGFQNGAAAGTGMVITPTGEVLTNNHVVDGATKITVQIAGAGPSYTARVLGTDATDDVALVQIDGASTLKTVKLGDSSKAAVGDQVVAIGNALGLPGPPSVSDGAITALDQSITASDQGGGNAENLTGLIQTDAPLRPGDSGGPLVNTTGQVIGMDTAASGGRRSSSGSNVAFAIPINSAIAVAHQIEAGHASAAIHIGPSALLGVQIQTASSAAGGGATSGAVVEGVSPNTPAQAAGLAAGDTIVSMDGKPVGSASDLTQLIGSHHPGDTARITWVDQSGKSHTATVRLATGPAN
jgi:S1-C subfamily serine protease